MSDVAHEPSLHVKDYIVSASKSNSIQAEAQPSSHGAHSYNSPAWMETSTSPWILEHKGGEEVYLQNCPFTDDAETPVTSMILLQRG